MKQKWNRGMAVFAAFCISVMPVGVSASGPPAAVTPKQAADALHAQGLFEGTGKGYELEQPMTRAQAATMFVKVLGKNDEAQKGTWTTPFTDVEGWAKPYIGYAYSKGLTAGVSATRFGSGEYVSYPQYLTFMLKALGYEAGKDFQWDKSYELSNQIGLTSGIGAKSQFLRGDAAVVSLTLLNMRKEGDTSDGSDGKTTGGAVTMPAISIGSYEDFAGLWKKDFFSIENGVEGYVYDTKADYRPEAVIAALKKVPNDLAEYYAKEFLKSISQAKNCGIYFNAGEEGADKGVLYVVRKQGDEWTFTNYLDGNA